MRISVAVHEANLTQVVDGGRNIVGQHLIEYSN